MGFPSDSDKICYQLALFKNWPFVSDSEELSTAWTDVRRGSAAESEMTTMTDGTLDSVTWAETGHQGVGDHRGEADHQLDHDHPAVDDHHPVRDLHLTTDLRSAVVVEGMVSFVCIYLCYCHIHTQPFLISIVVYLSEYHLLIITYN